MLNGIDEQVRKAELAVAGKTVVMRNRFVKLTNATKTVNRDLEAKARALAGIKGFVTNIADPTPAQVFGAYHQAVTDREALPDGQTGSSILTGQ